MNNDLVVAHTILLQHVDNVVAIAVLHNVGHTILVVLEVVGQSLETIGLTAAQFTTLGSSIVEANLILGDTILLAEERVVLEGQLIVVSCVNLLRVLGDVEVETDTGVHAPIEFGSGFDCVELVVERGGVHVHAQTYPLGETPNVLQTNTATVAYLISVIVCVTINLVGETAGDAQHKTGVSIQVVATIGLVATEAIGQVIRHIQAGLPAGEFLGIVPGAIRQIDAVLIPTGFGKQPPVITEVVTNLNIGTGRQHLAERHLTETFIDAHTQIAVSVDKPTIAVVVFKIQFLLCIGAHCTENHHEDCKYTLFHSLL